jgi:hypothetical protein
LYRPGRGFAAEGKPGFRAGAEGALVGGICVRDIDLQLDHKRIAFAHTTERTPGDERDEQFLIFE